MDICFYMEYARYSHCRQRTRGRIMRKIDDEIRDDEVDAMLEEELIKEAAMVEKALLAKPGIQEVTPEETLLHVSVPANTTATICLDGAKEVKAADGLTFTAGDGFMQAEAGSGDYEIHFVR